MNDRIIPDMTNEINDYHALTVYMHAPLYVKDFIVIFSRLLELVIGNKRFSNTAIYYQFAQTLVYNLSTSYQFGYSINCTRNLSEQLKVRPRIFLGKQYLQF